jgi:plasmid stabilization system protein ParE
MAILNWTYEAERCLREIHTYIAIDSPKSANQVIAGIYKKAQLLKDFPEIGYQYRTEPEGDIRILLYGHHRIAYLIRSQQQIDILGVFHGAMAIENHLK